MLSHTERKGLYAKYEKRKCICCGGSPCVPDVISGTFADIRRGEEDLWALCEKHHLEKRRLGLIAFSAFHPNTVTELLKKGFPGAAAQAKALYMHETFPWM